MWTPLPTHEPLRFQLQSYEAHPFSSFAEYTETRVDQPLMTGAEEEDEGPQPVAVLPSAEEEPAMPEALKHPVRAPYPHLSERMNDDAVCAPPFPMWGTHDPYRIQVRCSTPPRVLFTKGRRVCLVRAHRFLPDPVCPSTSISTLCASVQEHHGTFGSTQRASSDGLWAVQPSEFAFVDRLRWEPQGCNALLALGDTALLSASWLPRREDFLVETPLVPALLRGPVPADLMPHDVGFEQHPHVHRPPAEFATAESIAAQFYGAPH